MASNPFEDDEALRRKAQLDALGGGEAPKVLGQQPDLNTTMPVANPNLAAPSPVNTTMSVATTPKVPDLPAAASPVATPATGKRDQWSIGSDVNDRGDFGRLTGFNQASFDPMSGEQSFKNQMGRIMSRYDPRSPNAIQQIAADPDFKASGYRIVGNDKIVGSDGFPVDILRNANEGGSGDAWAWQTSNPADQGGAPGGASAAPGLTAGAPIGGESNMAAILAEIQSLADGTESPSKRKAVMDLLMDPAAQSPAI